MQGQMPLLDIRLKKSEQQYTAAIFSPPDHLTDWAGECQHIKNFFVAIVCYRIQRQNIARSRRKSIDRRIYKKITYNISCSYVWIIDVSASHSK